MKKSLLPFCCLLFCCFSGAAQVDTAAVAREVDSLIQVSRNMATDNKPKEALDFIWIAEEKARNKLGGQDTIYANCLFQHARLLQIFNYHKEAIEYYLLSNRLYHDLLGNTHPNYAAGLAHLGWIYGNAGQLEEGKQALLESKSIYESGQRKESLDYATAIHNLGLIHHMAAEYEQAESRYLQAQAIRKKIAGESHRVYTISLMSLGLLYYETARFDKAESVYFEALAIEENLNAGNSMTYAKLLNNIGIFYWNLGQLEKAEYYHLKARAVKEKILGKEHSSYAMTLHNLALVYEDLGQRDNALSTYLECKAIREKMLGKGHPDYALTLNNAGTIYQQRGDYEQSEAFHLEAKAIREKAFGREHPEYVMSLTNLANLYRSMKRPEEALALEEEGRAIREKIQGKGHPYYAFSLIGLAKTYNELGQTDKVEPLYLEAKSLREKQLGKLHRKYLETTEDLFGLYLQMDSPQRAEPLIYDLLFSYRQRTLNGMKFLQERELAQFVNSFERIIHKFFSFGLHYPSNSFQFSQSAWDNALFYKGLIQESVLTLHKNIEMAPDSIQEHHRNWKSYLGRLAAQYTRPIAERDSALIAELETKADETEKGLARTVAGFGEALRQVNWQEVQAALQAGEAAIEFIRFDYYTPKPTDSILYAALLLRPGMESPAFISLFEEKELEALLAPLAGLGGDGWNELYAGQAGESLYRLLWQPLEAHLDGVKTVYFSPSGLLHRLNLSAIPTGKPGEAIGGKFDLSAVGSTRQLAVGGGQQAVPGAETAVIFGGIQYEMDSTAIAPAEPGALALSYRGPSFSQTDSSLRGGTWKYLKYSDKEADNIQSLLQTAGFQAEVRKGYAATEEAFKSLGRGLPSPRILHVSTHGFFFPEAPPAPPAPPREGSCLHPPLRRGAGGGLPPATP